MDKEINPYDYGRIIGLIVEAVQEMPWIIQVNNRGELEFAQAIADKIIKIVQGDNKMDKNTISEYVNKYYEMDLETEDLLRDGSLVVDGMKVLREPAVYRVSISENMSDREIYLARRLNRWCTVTESEITSGGVLSFVGVYEDGTKAKRMEPVTTAWFVKKDSFPRIDILMKNDGQILAELPTAKMVAYLKDCINDRTRLVKFDTSNLKMQTGIDGDIVPLDEYVIAEGLMAGPSLQEH